MGLKQITVTMLLLVYGTEILAPLIPFADYFINKKYIEQNLCINRNNPNSHCHGTCHLKKELYLLYQSENGKPQQDKKTVLPLKAKEYVRELVTGSFQKIQIHINRSSTKIFFLRPYAIKDYIKEIFHPPPRA